jgi:hypothetical protein
MTTLPADMSLAEIEKYLEPAEYQELLDILKKEAREKLFVPTPKQLEVVNSPADVIGYGGAAGGGKSYLITGLTVHPAAEEPDPEVRHRTDQDARHPRRL